MTIGRREFLKLSAAAAGAAVVHPELAFTSSATAATQSEPTRLGISEAAALIQAGKLSPVELTRLFLDRIGRLNTTLNAFITVSADSALEQARQAEHEIRAGHSRGPLQGIPIAIKDNIDTAGIRTTAASALFKDRVPLEDAEVVARLKKAGAVLLGKTNLHEFALGGTSATSYFGPVHNPWDLSRIPGGSSGGSAVAVAANLCCAALGTDTAGSLRIPAAYCGAVGFKATYGLISNRGVIPAAWTLDHVGSLCKSVTDAELLLGVIAGYDQLERSPVRTHLTVHGELPAKKGSGFRLGILREYFVGVEPVIEAAVQGAIKVLSSFGSVADVKLPWAMADLNQLWAKVRAIEGYAYHAESITKTPELYEKATRERILQGSTESAVDYANARHRVELLRRDVDDFFKGIDVLVLPTMLNSPVTIAEAADPMIVSIRNTAPFDVLGVPAVSLPCGFTSTGLPIGLQLVASPFADKAVLAVARSYEDATDWHRRRPSLST